ncbi:hypothetical protein DOTSEDRAFT_173172 [Dothistroma septosporum NZE10]|uniref:DUF218 domain-containing protein n=1 Tax=Dothistroma septosporum (strain NZE10 / CBS 128990) TaxID=675120 RepID=N1PMZ2_DOTSN|nr:hypothetical protein DOTSEDRAFT_173172 [Dothistroma septosporum NZE10]
MASIKDDGHLLRDVNTVASFLAHEQVTREQLQKHDPFDCIILCVSALIVQAEQLFRILETRPSLTRCLVLVGGVGHSTEHLWNAIEQHEQYRAIGSEVRGLPEARVMETLLQKYFDVNKITSQGCQILIEDQSTNCGSNAIETRKVLDAAGLTDINTTLIVQDPTMSLRTLKSFEKAYESSDSTFNFHCGPLFIPTIAPGIMPDQIIYDTHFPAPSLWPFDRFLSLIIGETPRLRDNVNGYGPKGKNFIGHVDIPLAVEAAWERLQSFSGTTKDRLP